MLKPRGPWEIEVSKGGSLEKGAIATTKSIAPLSGLWSSVSHDSQGDALGSNIYAPLLLRKANVQNWSIGLTG